VARQQIVLTVNGAAMQAEVEPRLLLVHCLRDVWRLTGTHIGCDTSHCGACTVLLDGKAVKSCSIFAVQANGAEVMTVEGMEQDGKLHPVQEGFWQEHGLQCGFCTPGMMLAIDPAEFRLKNFVKPEHFPYRSALGWEYDSGNYAGALHKAMEMMGYAEMRKQQLEKRKNGELMGIGISSFTEIVGAGPSKHFDILGIKMFDSCEIRIHPTGKAIARFGTKSQGQGHETTYAQIIAEELGIPADHIAVEEGDTDTCPYGLGTYASRSTPTAGAAGATAARKIREKARKIAAHLLEANEEDLEWEPGRFFVRGTPAKGKTIQEIAFAAYTNHPPAMEAGLEAVSYYDPPNLTYPFGSYICVVDIDKGTGEVKIRRFVAVDDCGNIINPMIVEGQIHGGLTMGLAPALYEEINYDEEGNIQGGSFMDYLLPTAVETPKWETAKTCTPSPHHPLGAKGVGESATVGAPAAIVNAVVDALWHLGVRHIDLPLTPAKVWKCLRDHGVTE